MKYIQIAVAVMPLTEGNQAEVVIYALDVGGTVWVYNQHVYPPFWSQLSEKQK